MKPSAGPGPVQLWRLHSHEAGLGRVAPGALLWAAVLGAPLQEKAEQTECQCRPIRDSDIGQVKLRVNCGK